MASHLNSTSDDRRSKYHLSARAFRASPVFLCNSSSVSRHESSSSSAGRNGEEGLVQKVSEKFVLQK